MDFAGLQVLFLNTAYIFIALKHITFIFVRHVIYFGKHYIKTFSIYLLWYPQGLKRIMPCVYLLQCNFKSTSYSLSAGHFHLEQGGLLLCGPFLPAQ